jgi:hypothetical protein
VSLPIIWFHGFALLVAAIPLWREDRARRLAGPAGPASAGPIAEAASAG